MEESSPLFTLFKVPLYDERQSYNSGEATKFGFGPLLLYSSSPWLLLVTSHAIFSHSYLLVPGTMEVY